MNLVQTPGDYRAPSIRIVPISVPAVLCASARTEGFEEFEIPYE